MAKRLNLEEIIKRFNKVHGDRYIYDEIKEYKNLKTKVPVICKVHGVFYVSPYKHLLGQGCPKCARNHKLTTEEFIERAKKVHGDKYDYSKVVYVDTDTKVCIICPIHGEFWQTPHMHLKGQGCPKCYGNDTKTTEQFIEEAKKVHGDKYIYDETIYKNAYSKVVITCPIHGNFEQRARTHLYGHGCPQCSGKKKYNKDYFIIKAREVHGNKYDYSLIKEIKNNRDLLPIICPKHGIFYQTVDNHINGKQGCPKCQRSSLEEKVALFLEKNGIEYEEQKKFEWLGSQRLDFYLPQYNIAIECQGIQHFLPYGNFGSSKITKEEIYKKICKLDDLKNKLCNENNLPILYYAETQKKYRYPILTNQEELLVEIKKYLKK